MTDSVVERLRIPFRCCPGRSPMYAWITHATQRRQPRVSVAATLSIIQGAQESCWHATGRILCGADNCRKEACANVTDVVAKAARRRRILLFCWLHRCVCWSLDGMLFSEIPERRHWHTWRRCPGQNGDESRTCWVHMWECVLFLHSCFYRFKL